MKKGIVILGCGLSGMLTALSFAKRNIKTTILEYQSINAINFGTDIRTTALTPASVKFLNNINIWDKLEIFASKMLEVYVVDNKAPEMLWLKDVKNNEPLGYIISNNDLKKILLEEVKQNALIEIIDQFDYQKVESQNDQTIIYYQHTKLPSDDFAARRGGAKPIDNRQALSNNACKFISEEYKMIQSDLLVVCDGVNSKVRSYYFSNKIEKTYQQTALTFNIRHNKSHDNCAIEHFMPSGPFAILPLKNPFCSSVIWSTAERQAPLLLNLSKEQLEYLVNKNCGNSLGIIQIDSEISTFPLKARVSNKYFYNRIVLVADSAHLIHPLAGQGLNQGIKDIDTLTQLIFDREIHQETLAQYHKLRQEDNFIMYMITENLNSIFSNHSKALWYLRRLGFVTIDKVQFVKNFILQYAMGKR
ncbi:FAD-dependent monooxygenase [Candidatus Tisiphia endosymbiont of Beris chalybata]|uniref:FAD-dependent monooxygenase n=1 Tax=Candidatus Tisiphia endosymbiont of Beris chalybata TaxID=3066262 RepID=UPI00312CB6A7